MIWRTVIGSLAVSVGKSLVDPDSKNIHDKSDAGGPYKKTCLFEISNLLISIIQSDHKITERGL